MRDTSKYQYFICANVRHLLLVTTAGVCGFRKQTCFSLCDLCQRTHVSRDSISAILDRNWCSVKQSLIASHGLDPHVQGVGIPGLRWVFDVTLVARRQSHNGGKRPEVQLVTGKVTVYICLEFCHPHVRALVPFCQLAVGLLHGLRQSCMHIALVPLRNPACKGTI